jgi:hypothetical protein
LLPRTIDKLRAELPGGNLGPDVHPVMAHRPELSVVLDILDADDELAFAQ